MASDSELGRHGEHLAALYVVEVQEGGERPRYVICERLLVVGPGQTVDGVSDDMLRRLLSEDALRAVALPTAESGGGEHRWRALAQTAQSGHRPGLNITINNFPDRDYPKK